MATASVYLEVGSKRTFACAVDWPGWARSGKTEEAALGALLDAADRYAAVAKRAAAAFDPPAAVDDLVVVERVAGNATTDFGALGVVPELDDAPLPADQARDQARLLDAAWAAFDAAVVQAHGATLRKGPRGGGRELAAIADHVLDSEIAYLRKLGGKVRRSEDRDAGAEMQRVRDAVRDVIAVRARGGDPPHPPPRSALWPLPYAIRRSAWHALDHAWEIIDRA